MDVILTIIRYLAHTHIPASGGAGHLHPQGSVRKTKSALYTVPDSSCMNRGSLAVLIAALFLIAAGLSVMYLGTDGSDAKNEGFTYVRNGDDVTVTGHGALEYDSAWSGLKTLTLNVDGEAASIESWGFNGCDSLEAVTVNGPVGSIGDHAFGYCGSLTTVTVNGSVGSIGWAAFEYCGSLTTVTVNGSVGSIGGVAFEALDCLTTVTVNGPVGSIGGVAFGSCHHLKELTIAGPITSPIGENAFLDCGDLKTVNIACNDPRNIIKGHSDNGAIAYYADTVNHVHRYSATYDWADDGSSCTVNIVCANTSDHNHDENAAVTSSVKVKPTAIAPGTTGYSVSGTYDGFAYSDTKDIQDIPPVTEGTQGDFRWTMDGTSLTVTGHGTLDWDPLWVGLTSLTLVPDGGTGIGVHAFDHCDSLTAVTVNGDVGVIDDNAFYECDSLVTVTVQGSVGGLGHAAFASCDGMTAFTVSGSLGSVGSDAFASCDVLTAFTVQVMSLPSGFT